MSFERGNQVVTTQYDPTVNHRPTIATLPTNRDVGSPNHPEGPAIKSTAVKTTTLEPAEGAVLMAADYTEKSFVVFGDGTKIHKESIKALGGKYNGRLREKPGFPGGPAWIFPQTMKPKVFEFVQKVNEGTVATQQGVPDQGPQGALPTVIVPQKNNKYQTVRWKVFLPIEGMRVTIKANGTQMEGEVLQTETHRDVVDTVYITMGGNTSKLVICNGAWQVWGYMVDHSVFFSDKTVSDNTVQNGNNQYKPNYATGTDDDIQDVYRDVAGI